MTADNLAWLLDACSLPTADRPLRLAEFDDLFATAEAGLAFHGTRAASMAA